MVVSSQTGFSRHLRYALPALPAVFILASAMVNTVKFKQKLVMLLLAGYILASVSVLPRSYSFFSYLIGGPKSGWKYLSDSSLDWGQDLLTLKDWQSRNPEKRPLYVLYSPTSLSLRKLGIYTAAADARSLLDANHGNCPKRSGWWAVFAQPYTLPEQEWFRMREPTERPSVSLWIYEVTEDDLVAREDENTISSRDVD